LFVNVMHKIFSGETFSSSIKCCTRETKTCVFPLPGPARTLTKEGFGDKTAFACCVERFEEHR
jgi:hypothetical protein